MPEDSRPKISGIQSKKAAMVPKKVLKQSKPLSLARANPWDTLPRKVQVDIGNLRRVPWMGRTNHKSMRWVITRWRFLCTRPYLSCML